MRGVKFGSFHSGNDWNMILSSKSLTPPTPKTMYVSVDGRDGDLDLSEALTGEVKYSNRAVSYKFTLTEGTYDDRNILINDILKTVHGRKLKIIIDDDIDHYFYGRCSVTEVNNHKAYGELTIEGNCEPWRYSVREVVRTIEVNGNTLELPCVNSGVKTLIPELQVTGSINIEFDNANVALSDGTYKITDLKLKTGLTILTVSGTGTLVVTYREGFL